MEKRPIQSQFENRPRCLRSKSSHPMKDIYCLAERVREKEGDVEGREGDVPWLRLIKDNRWLIRRNSSHRRRVVPGPLFPMLANRLLSPSVSEAHDDVAIIFKNYCPFKSRVEISHNSETDVRGVLAHSRGIINKISPRSAKFKSLRRRTGN